MNFSSFVRSRLAALGLGQKDLARAAQVTDSYVSQLLTRKKAPPARDRTDIYARMEAFLRLEPGELGRLADNERAEELKRKLSLPPEPLFEAFRDLVLRKCVPDKRDDVRAIFELQSFGTLERLVAQALLEVVQRVARRELDSDSWQRLAAHVGGRSHEELRVIALEFLDTNVFQVSKENCSAFIEPLVESWDVDLQSLRLDIRLNADLVEQAQCTFAFVEQTRPGNDGEEPGLADFLGDPQLSGDTTDEELEQLRQQRFGRRRPNKLYYYRALQSLRDRMHFDED